MITISPNSESDFKTIISIAEIVWPVTYGAILANDQLHFMFEMMYSVASLQQHATSKNHHFIIAYENGVPCGFASFEHNCESSNKTKVHKIYILPTLQGKGIGKKMIEYVSVEALRKRENAIFLNVNRYNSAKLFYQKIGFIVTKEIDIEIGNGYLMEDYVMEMII